MIIGITGGTGCGKTTALNAIRQLGGTVIDCDRVYHDLLRTDRSLICAIENRFPGTVNCGILDRKKLGNLVFSDPRSLEDLNRITHEAIVKAVRQLLIPEPDLGAIDAIRLFESGLQELCDLTVCVTAPEDVRVSRLMARDRISAPYAARRIAAQPPQDYYRKLCTYELKNDGAQQEFLNKCLAFFGNPDIIKEEKQ